MQERPVAASSMRRRLVAAPWMQVALVAVCVVLGMQAIRVLVPLVYHVRETSSVVLALGIAVAAFLGPLVAIPLRRMTGPATTVVAVAVLAILRVALQLLHPIPIWIAAVTAGWAMLTWAVLLDTDGEPTLSGRAGFVLGFFLGLATDTALRSLFRTWDLAWQAGAVPLVVTGVLGLAAVCLAVIARPSPSGGEGPDGRAGGTFAVALIGPLLMLELLFLQNVAYADSAAGVSLAVGAAVVLLGDAAAITVALLMNRGRVKARALDWMAGGFLLLASWLISTEGAGVLALILVAQTCAGALLGSALVRDGRPADSHLTPLAVALGGEVFLVLAFLYQINIVSPLPFSGRLIPVVAAGAMMLGAVGVGPVADRQRTFPPALMAAWVAVLLVVPLGLGATAPAPTVQAGSGRSYRLMSWNIHSAMNGNGQLDPEEIALEVGRQDPDVLVLQEVPRGWAISGSFDMAEWLLDRLDMPYRWAAAADGQFGNLVLSRLPIGSVRKALLPYGDGPQHRSYLLVELDVDDGREATVVCTHLEGGSPTRATQIETILRTVEGRTSTVIAGDMNVQPDDEADVALFTGAGFASAQDATGHGSESTARDPNFPGDRPDWIFGTSDVAFDDFRIVRSEASDHLPLVVTISFGGHDRG
ncbi:MAG: endonuclease/exonuclease/phosphatase family protein [Actinomycetota bacterium]